MSKDNESKEIKCKGLGEGREERFEPLGLVKRPWTDFEKNMPREGSVHSEKPMTSYWLSHCSLFGLCI